MRELRQRSLRTLLPTNAPASCATAIRASDIAIGPSAPGACPRKSPRLLCRGLQFFAKRRSVAEPDRPRHFFVVAAPVHSEEPHCAAGRASLQHKPKRLGFSACPRKSPRQFRTEPLGFVRGEAQLLNLTAPGTFSLSPLPSTPRSRTVPPAERRFSTNRSA